jgi:hypothetical protein
MLTSAAPASLVAVSGHDMIFLPLIITFLLVTFSVSLMGYLRERRTTGSSKPK